MLKQDKKNKLVVITGPTGIGKTELSFDIQKQVGCSIISADSRQVYKEMSIGTAKPSRSEIDEYHIKCCDYVSIHEDYSAGHFVNDALEQINADFTIHGYSIVCGGTGMYIKALCEGMHEFPDIPEVLKDKWNRIYEESGIEELQSSLKDSDPEYYNSIDIHNPHRLLRALTVIDHSGKKFSHFLDKQQEEREFECIYVVLDIPRDKLYQRIESRVDRMMDQGLLEEARSLIDHRALKALNTVAYVELFDHLDGKTGLDEAIDLIKTHSRQYAKRQLTWFRKFIDAPRFDPGDIDAIMKYVRMKLSLE